MLSPIFVISKHMDPIREYLENKKHDFRTGVMLLLSTGRETRLVGQMIRCVDAPSIYMREKLIYELQKICPDAKYRSAPAQLPQIHYNPGDPRDSHTEEKNQAAQEQITSRAIPEEAKALHKEHGYQHELMRHAASDADRLIIATRIMSDIIPSLDALYRGESTTPEEIPADVPLTPLEMSLEIHRLRSRISKARKKLTAGTGTQADIDDLIEKRIGLQTQLTSCQNQHDQN